VPGAIQQGVSEEPLDVAQDNRVTCWMKSVATIVNGLTIHVKTPRVSPNRRPLFDYRNGGLVIFAQLARRPRAGRSGTENDDMRLLRLSMVR